MSMDDLNEYGKHVDPPKLGEIVHYVCHADNEEIGCERGQELPLLVQDINENDKYPDRWAVRGVAYGAENVFRVFALDDDRELPGTWHRDRDCLVSETLKRGFHAGPGASE